MGLIQTPPIMDSRRCSPHTFPHQRLDAYVVALQLACQAKALADRVPRGHRTLADQLMRAAGSTVLNIAEGGKGPP